MRFYINMLTVICTLKFKDGQSVTGQISAESPEGEYRVQYKGAVERIEARTPENVVGLIYFFKSIARETGAEFQIDQSGQYDTWAE